MSREKPPSYAELLDQDKVWWSRQGRDLVCYDVDEMELEHIKRLRMYLLRNAESIHYGILNNLHYLAARAIGEQAQIEADRDIKRMQEEDPEEWIRETVFFETLTSRLESLSVGYLTKTNLATLMRLVKLALSAPPGTHTENQLRDIEAVRRKLSGTGRETA